MGRQKTAKEKIVVRKIRVGQGLLGTSILLTEDRDNTTAFDTPGPWYPANQPGPDTVAAQVIAIGEMLWRGKRKVTLKTSIGEVRLRSITQSVIPANGDAPPGAPNETSPKEQSMTDVDTAKDARGALLAIISNLTLAELAQAAAHEYDDEAAVPAPNSLGETFLLDARDRYVDWVQREGRFPDLQQIEQEEAGATWHHQEATPSQRAQAFVDLGMYFSGHAATASSADIAGLTSVLDAAADRFAEVLTETYGPVV